MTDVEGHSRTVFASCMMAFAYPLATLSPERFSPFTGLVVSH